MRNPVIKKPKTLPLFLVVATWVLFGWSSYAAATSSTTDTQCDDGLTVTIASSIRTSATASSSCQARTLTNTIGFALATTAPAPGNVVDSLALRSAGGELYEATVAGVRQATVLLSPNRTLMMSRTYPTDADLHWDFGLTVRPVASATTAWLTGTYVFLRTNTETRVVGAHQTDAAQSQVFDPVIMRTTFNGDGTCSIASYSSWLGYSLTTDSSGFYSQPDGTNYGFHQADYAGEGSGQQHKTSALSITTCTYSLSAAGKLVITPSGTYGDATAYNSGLTIKYPYYVSADMRYITSTADGTNTLYRGFELGVRVGTVSGVTQTDKNNSIAPATFLFNSPSVEYQGSTSLLPVNPNNHTNINNQKVKQCFSEGSLELSQTALTAPYVGWNSCTAMVERSCFVRSESGYAETAPGNGNGTVSILTSTESALGSPTCRFQVAANGDISFVMNASTAQGNQDITYSGVIADNKQAIVLRGKYQGANMQNPSSLNAPERTISSDLYLSGLVGIQYTGTLSADADSDGYINKAEFIVKGVTAGTDTDSDTMPDSWEATYGLDLLLANAGSDTDRDGYTNLQEYTNSTNPAVPNVPLKNDFGGDGKSDLLLRNGGTGEFFLSTQNGLTVVNQSVVGAFSDVNNVLVSTGDFDGDGDADMLTRGTVDGVLPGTFRVELTAGATVTSAAWMNTMSTDLNDVVMSTKDFNKDGKADVLLRNSATGVWTINYMNGTSAPTIGTLNASTDLCYTMQGDGDYDGNGYPDILLRRDACGGATYPWLVQTLQGSFTVLASGVATGVSMNTGWATMVADGDFNGDGKSDILLRDRGASPQLWLEYDMNGVGAPSSNGQLPIAVQSMWQLAADGDFNGDGKDDLLLRSVDTGQWYAYLMNDRTVLGSAAIGMEINPIWSLQALDDNNGDGKTDIMIRNDAGGAWYLYLMNGLNIASKAILPLTYDLGYSLQND